MRQTKETQTQQILLKDGFQQGYGRLLRRISHLSKELLPEKNPTASYQEGQVLRMLSFRLLVHAEMEGFIESCSLDLISFYSNKVNKGLRPTVKLLLFRQRSMIEHYPPITLSFEEDIQNSSLMNKQILAFLKCRADVVDKNNGISEKDILKLFVPLGVDLSFFDHRWLRSMTVLARRRGDVAHSGWDGSVGIEQPTPEGERAVLVEPLFGLRKLVDQLNYIQSNA